MCTISLSESLWFMNYNKSKVVDFAKDSISLQGCSSVMLTVMVNQVKAIDMEINCNA